jgi:hypothetical protein
MKRIKTIVFVFVPIYIEIARIRVPKPAVVVSSQDRHLQDRREATSDWPFWAWFIDNLDRDPRLCYENYFPIDFA